MHRYSTEISKSKKKEKKKKKIETISIILYFEIKKLI